MRACLFAAAVAALVVPAARAEDDNPYKNAKVGDYATYKMTLKFGGLDITGDVTSTVTAKTDKEATVKATGKIGGMEVPATEQKIDLTKPFDPTKLGSLPAGTDAKVEKKADGKEKITVGGKAYDATWATYKVTAKAKGVDINADVKAWMSKDIPLGLGKMEMSADVAGQKMNMTMELAETGNKK